MGQVQCRGRFVGAAVAALVLTLGAAPASRAADRVLWGNGNHTVSYANLDGSGGGLLDLTGAVASGVRGVDVDPVTGRIYWANQGNDTISYANLDGSGGGGQLNAAGARVDRPHGVAIDPATRRIYWANDTGNPISYARLDGSGGGDLPTPGTAPAGPYGVAIDTAAKRIFWANRDTDTISYAALDGSGGAELNIAGATTDKPHGVAIDPAAGKVYWSNLGNTITYANLDGTGEGAQLNPAGAGSGGPIGIAIDPSAGRIWWANLGNDQISFVARDGSGGGGQLNIAGAASSDARFLALVQTPRPDGVPAISGETAVGSVLSCSQPSWAPDVPDSFLYRAPQTITNQWSRDGTDIAGATAGVYTAFAPGTYRCRVTAVNPAGETPLTSAAHTVTAPQNDEPERRGSETPSPGAPAAGIAAAAAPFPPPPASFEGSASTITVNRRGGFRFTFGAAQGLTGRATFETVGTMRASRKGNRRKRLTLARMAFTVRPGGTVAVGGRLSKESFRVLKLKGRVPTRVTVTLQDAAGLTTTTSRTISLEAPRPRTG